MLDLVQHDPGGLRHGRALGLKRRPELPLVVDPRREGRPRRIGEPFVRAHAVGDPGAEIGAPQDAVHHLEGDLVGVAPADAQVPDRNAPLVHVGLVDDVDARDRREIGLGNRRDRLLRDGPAGERLLEPRLHVGGPEVARDGEDEVPGMVVLPVKGDEVLAGQRLDRRLRAVRAREVLFAAQQPVPLARLDRVARVVAALHGLELLALVEIEPVL